MEAETWILLSAIMLIALLAGFVHSAIGFGFGIVAISLAPLVIDARTAHVVVSVSSVPMLMMAAWAYRRGIEWESLWQALLGAALFLPLGLLLFETASLDWLVRGTGLGILAMVMMSLRNQELKPAANNARMACFTAGAAAGFLGGAVSIAGPPVAAFALKQDWSQVRFKAFVTQCLLIIAAYKAGLLVARGYVVGEAVWQSVVVSVAAIVGVQVGLVVSQHLSAARFKRLVAITLLVVAVTMMVRGSS